MPNTPRETPRLDDAREALEWLRGEEGLIPERDVEAALARVLRPLLAAEGYVLSRGPQGRDPGFDFVARSSSDPVKQSLCIEFKFLGRGRPIGTEIVREVRARAARSGLARAMLLGRFGFTPAARQEASYGGPRAVELLDLNDMVAWADRVEQGEPECATRFHVLIRQLSHDFAAQVAKDPRML